MIHKYSIRPNSLVLYKKRPGRVIQVGDKVLVELENRDLAKVRLKDVQLLHPGPINSLSELEEMQGEQTLAWEILISETPAKALDLEELAELIYGDYSPSSAFASWNFVADGLYFRGLPDRITANSPESVQAEQATRLARQNEARNYIDFKERAQSGQIDIDADASYLREVEDLAFGRRKTSRLLIELGRGQRPENAHALLLECGYWNKTTNPYPVRLGLPASPPELSLPAFPDETRLDLTQLPAYAIDDRDNRDPDDAISLEYCQLDEDGAINVARIWVHVADAAALVPPDSPPDHEARARSATCYLPEGAMPMLPFEAIEKLGLGLRKVSPALSFAITLNPIGEIIDLQIQPSQVRVQRLSYETVEERILTYPFRELHRLAQMICDRRTQHGALLIDLPESIVRVLDGQVSIRPVLRLRSRDLVREAMLIAGEAAARFAIEHQIPFPYVTQEAPERSALEQFALPLGSSSQEDLSLQDNYEYLVRGYGLRRFLKRSHVSGIPAPHAGVGLPFYSRVTSPLRRYLDLVAHQQIRAHLRGERTLSQTEILERLGSSEAIVSSVNQADALSRRHWTLVYLIQNPGWQGEAVLVEVNGLRGRVIIPELALEETIHLRRDIPLGERLILELSEVDLPELEAHFTVKQLSESRA